ncbi:hypothetical protein JK386_06715 [Nocardioides sp. zg-536]|uniref:OLD protein-like TOPRIM domain-containing protein n=1 Tax=Nocardioides faecalis TaxID=2803858 RepID=A0A938Y9A3_9ACTN|nr:TOPRIM nucleotidyl transferase/hydrolase domain-containing protein [Nocardioides faecalis]MBM9459589.1 hypothetical protein [Nocardioides faecalis]QVI58115.1 hypothetical protein KG111_14010 [Nocardioides faecalis]
MPRPITLLVEGDSDRAALLALAPRFGVDLGAEDITVTAIGGAGNFGRAIADAAAAGHRGGGLYDEGEERFVAGTFNRQPGEDLTRHGFFACRPDLEAELIRALGVVASTALLEEHGDGSAFRTFQQQPAHRDEEVAAQLHRFLGTTAGRKARYAALMAEDVDFEAVPEPLSGLLSWIWTA